jgi:hypothetical protein
MILEDICPEWVYPPKEWEEMKKYIWFGGMLDIQYYEDRAVLHPSINKLIEDKLFDKLKNHTG